MTSTLILGAVAYDPKVVTIWEGFKDHFAAHGLAFDYVLYSNYESQVLGHFAGQCHVAWNSPLAWIEAERLAARRGRTARAIAMRDSDCDLTSVIVIRADSGIATLADLKGKRIAVGATDSPQATLIPLERLAAAGLEPGRDIAVTHFNIGVGKHGDHIGGERDAARALMDCSADACCILDANRVAFAREATLPTAATRVLAETEPFDHCNFTALDDAPPALLDRFVAILMAMSYDDPAVRPLLDLEGLKAWKPGRTSGYAALNRAVDRAGGLDAFLPG
ncbi:MAG: PhnD/SsuA/transferrin family substrate-binding protein [Sphingomonadales bacterium]|nr:PhnD/SsuA/transferrin family substrate-binding protein [Sphingomonadales bacterium]